VGARSPLAESRQCELASLRPLTRPDRRKSPSRLPRWRNGRRRGLKILRAQAHAGSSPALGNPKNAYLTGTYRAERSARRSTARPARHEATHIKESDERSQSDLRCGMIEDATGDRGEGRGYVLKLGTPRRLAPSHQGLHGPAIFDVTRCNPSLEASRVGKLMGGPTVENRCTIAGDQIAQRYRQRRNGRRGRGMHGPRDWVGSPPPGRTARLAPRQWTGRTFSAQVL
jgi:hypothetical protein